MNFFSDIKLCYDFDESIDFFGKKDHKYRRRDCSSGETGGIYLKGCDYF